MGFLVAGVMGWPISHSLSPRLHGHWLRRYGIDGAYLPLAVPPERIDDALAGLAALGFRGANVTVPHKERVAERVHRLDPTAARLGAVNTIVIGEDGQLEGRNTDGYGFTENLAQACPEWRADRGAAVVLGAGGAAAAIVCALLDAGVPEIRLVNRSLDRARRLGERLGGPIETVAWQDRQAALDGAALVVNSTSLGMTGQPSLELVPTGMRADCVVYDIVYAPLLTALLDQARRRGYRTVGGLGMLLHQARPGFAAWFGIDPTVDDALRDAVLKS